MFERVPSTPRSHPSNEPGPVVDSSTTAAAPSPNRKAVDRSSQLTRRVMVSDPMRSTRSTPVVMNPDAATRPYMKPAQAALRSTAPPVDPELGGDHGRRGRHLHVRGGRAQDEQADVRWADDRQSRGPHEPRRRPSSPVVPIVPGGGGSWPSGTNGPVAARRNWIPDRSTIHSSVVARMLRCPRSRRSCPGGRHPSPGWRSHCRLSSGAGLKRCGSVWMGQGYGCAPCYP